MHDSHQERSNAPGLHKVKLFAIDGHWGLIDHRDAIAARSREWVFDPRAGGHFVDKTDGMPMFCFVAERMLEDNGMPMCDGVSAASRSFCMSDCRRMNVITRDQSMPSHMLLPSYFAARQELRSVVDVAVRSRILRRSNKEPHETELLTELYLPTHKTPKL